MNSFMVILLSILYGISFSILIIWLLFANKKQKSRREQFEEWYISKFLRIMPNAEKVVGSLVNYVTEGYDDPHMDGAWEAWKHCKM